MPLNSLTRHKMNIPSFHSESTWKHGLAPVIVTECGTVPAMLVFVALGTLRFTLDCAVFPLTLEFEALGTLAFALVSVLLAFPIPKLKLFRVELFRALFWFEIALDTQVADLFPAHLSLFVDWCFKEFVLILCLIAFILSIAWFFANSVSNSGLLSTEFKSEAFPIRSWRHTTTHTIINNRTLLCSLNSCNVPWSNFMSTTNNTVVRRGNTRGFSLYPAMFTTRVTYCHIQLFGLTRIFQWLRLSRLWYRIVSIKT